MALRKFKCYRNIIRAYTRKSKFKKKSYVKTVPPMKIVRFDMGDPTRTFDYSLNLITKEPIQVRSNAIESARQVANRQLELKLGKTNYYFKVVPYPHHILRENKMLVGAGADRMQTGMQKAFGKPIGVAAQLRRGKRIFIVQVNKEGLEVAKLALKRAKTRLPSTWAVELVENKINILKEQKQSSLSSQP
jgi:large subunit ribosomal protein L10e